MTKGVGQALEQALAYWRAPALLAAARQRPLPEDVLDVVRIAAGDRASAEFAAAVLGARIEDLAEAAPFYLQQLLFAPGATSYRVLGVNPDAPDARIKEHYRWLVRWLHPDRNPDEWEALYADRVNRAWQDLRNPEKRAAYDASLSADWADLPAPVGAPSGANLRPLAPADTPILSGRTTQRLPIIVLGSFGLFAGALLTLMWYAKNPRTTHPVNVPAAITAESDRVEVPETMPAAEPAALAAAVVGPEGPATTAALAAQVPLAATPPAPPTPPTATQIPVGAPSGAKTPSPQHTLVATAPPPRVAPAALPVAARQAEAVGPEGPPTVESLAPAPATIVDAPLEASAATVPAPTNAPAPITEPEALSVLDQFTTAYAAGDLRALMRLFTRDATNNRGGRTEIAYDYQELFDDSESRELLIRPNGWLQGETSATLLARFEARITREGSWRSARSTGEIRFDLAREDGVLRIRNIRHEEY